MLFTVLGGGFSSCTAMSDEIRQERPPSIRVRMEGPNGEADILPTSAVVFVHQRASLRPLLVFATLPGGLLLTYGGSDGEGREYRLARITPSQQVSLRVRESVVRLTQRLSGLAEVMNCRGQHAPSLLLLDHDGRVNHEIGIAGGREEDGFISPSAFMLLPCTSAQASYEGPTLGEFAWTVLYVHQWRQYLNAAIRMGPGGEELREGVGFTFTLADETRLRTLVDL